MKKILSVTAILLLSCWMLGTGCSSSSKAQKNAETANVILEKVSKPDFEILVNPDLGFRGDYSLIVNKDKLSCWLPYAGHMTAGPSGGGEGMSFRSEVENYTLNVPEPGKMEITFSTKTDEDTYRFGIIVWSDATARIRVNSSKKTAVEYTGTLVTY